LWEIRAGGRWNGAGEVVVHEGVVSKDRRNIQRAGNTVERTRHVAPDEGAQRDQAVGREDGNITVIQAGAVRIEAHGDGSAGGSGWIDEQSKAGNRAGAELRSIAGIGEDDFSRRVGIHGGIEAVAAQRTAEREA